MPKTLNRRVSSLSSFYKYLAGCAAEFRLPIVVPNPAHAQFIARAKSDPVEETRALSATRARQLMGMPARDTVIDYRDRAILKFYLYSAARISTGCRLKVSDFHQDGEESTIRLHEKGDRRRTIGLHYAAAQAIREYIEKAGIEKGPLFRARRGSRSEFLSDRPMDPATMYLTIQAYLEQLPGSTKDGRCIYTPHSLRATTATLTPSPASDSKTVAEMIGEYVREAAVLVGVFAILDKLVEGREVTWTWAVTGLSASLALLVGGILIEVARRRSD